MTSFLLHWDKILTNKIISFHIRITFQRYPQRFPKNFPQKTQDFENIQFPISPLEAHTHHINNFASFFQVVKMFMVVVVIFAICWLPYHVYFIYTYHNKEVTTKPYIQHVYLSFYWLAMANAMINPAIYYGMNARYVQQWNLLS